MGSGLAQTLDQKPSNQLGLRSGLQTNSATSLTQSSYAVPVDGKLIPAIPIKMALRFKPATIAVVYQMHDAKSGRMKKYTHEIIVNFEKKYYKAKGNEIDMDALCDEICRKKQTYLNPTYISRK